MAGNQTSNRQHKEFVDGVAAELVALIKAGTAPWQKPWAPGAYEPPHNAATKTAYRGINHLVLEAQGHADPRWLTFKQAAAAGARVRAGEKGKKIEYWIWQESRPLKGADGQPVIDADGNIQRETVKLDRPKVLFSTVFNASQIDGLEPYKAPAPGFDPIERAEKVLADGGVEILHDQRDRAFYDPQKDQIRLPDKAAFPSACEYYATALHELGHATGHAKRLSRRFGPFGSDAYAREELRAELASYMVSRQLGLGHNPERHAAYCESWIKAIAENPQVLFRAARDAGRIATWIREPARRPELERIAQQNAEATMNRDNGQRVSPAQPAEKASRVYLAVPYGEKDEAKRLGAKWSSKQKSWYVLDSVDPKPFEKWRTGRAAARDERAVDPVEGFRKALQAQKMITTGPPVMDGQWHRIALETDKGGEKNGSYRGFLDGRPNGQIKNFVSGELTQWVADGEKLTPELGAAIKAEAAENHKNREQKTLALQQEAAEKAVEKLRQAKKPDGYVWAGPDEKALARMNPDEQKRWADLKAETLAQNYLMRKGAGAYGIGQDASGDLLVPARDIDGKIWSVQTISPDGTKRFAKNARKKATMHIIDPDKTIGAKAGLMPGSKLATSILVAEGYATAASLYEATGRPVVVAFDAGNLQPAAEALRAAHPEATLVIAADNDHKREHTPAGNVGWKQAARAAQSVNAYVVVPEFDAGQKEKGLTDWNDLALDKGAAVVKAAIKSQLRGQKVLTITAKSRDADKEQGFALPL